MDAFLFWVRIGAVIVVVFLAGLYSGVSHNWAYRSIQHIRHTVMLAVTEAENLRPDGTPVHFLQPARQPGSGVTINDTDDDDLIMLVGFFDGGNEVRLITRDGTPLARWPMSFLTHFEDAPHLTGKPATDWNIDLHGAVLNPDGSLVTNYEYSGSLKLDRCGDVIWRLNHQTHHSVTRSERGGYWIPGRVIREKSHPLPPFTEYDRIARFREDLILHVGEDGTIRTQKSVPEIMMENGLEPLFTAARFFVDGGWSDELVHVNKIAELPAALAPAFPMFDAGDLALSLRRYNLVFVVDPDTWRIKWHSTGPWLRQHDVEFNADGGLSVFNNNAYPVSLADKERTDLAAARTSNILWLDPASGTSEKRFGQAPGQDFLSVYRGDHQPTSDGGYLVAEHEAGRIFESDATGRIIWEYINRFDADQVLEITGAQRYPRDYFSVTDWTCP